MAGTSGYGGDRRGRRWRRAAWGGAAALLLLPLLAMQVTDAVAWDLADFAFAGALIVGVGMAYELAARRTGDRAYRAAVAVALAAGVLLVWVNAAVGIIGSEDNPANRLHAGVLAVAILGAIIARFRPAGMARVMGATALAQVAVAATVLGTGFGLGGPISRLDVVIATGGVAALWLISAGLFRKAARTAR